MEKGFTGTLKYNIFQAFFGSETAVDVLEKCCCPLYVGLFVDQGETDPVELIIGRNGYQRALVVFDMQSQNDYVVNSNSVTFEKAEADWASGMTHVTHIGIFSSHKVSDIESGEESWVSDEDDELWAFLPLSEAEQIKTGEIFQLNPMSIKMQLV